MPDDQELIALRNNLRDHQLEYERRHAELEVRLTRLEQIISNLVTQKDLSDFREIVGSLRKSVETLAPLADSMVSRKDIEWLRWLTLVLLGLITWHLLGIKLP